MARRCGGATSAKTGIPVSDASVKSEFFCFRSENPDFLSEFLAIRWEPLGAARAGGTYLLSPFSTRLPSPPGPQALIAWALRG